MKPYVVVAYGRKVYEEIHQVGRRDLSYYFSSDIENIPAATYHDTLESAEARASWAAEKHPGYSFIVAKSDSIVQCPPAKAVTSKFTEAGLLPS